MGIKGKILGLMAALLLPCLAARAQEVVIDPSQIAASAVNAADQVDYMIDQLGELTDLGDKLAGLKGYMDDLFGEDGVGGKAIGLLQDLGTIDRLAECYTSTMESAERYAARCRESGNWRMSDVNAILSYLNSSKREAEMILETVKKLLATAGFTKKEKMDQVDRAVAELETRLETMRKVMEIEEEAAHVAEGLSGFSDIVSRAADSREYVESKLALDMDVLLEIDVQGALQIKEKIPEAVLVFFSPPNMDELEKRLRGRATEEDDIVIRRLMDAAGELSQQNKYDYVLINDDLNSCVDKYIEIIKKEREKRK